MSLLMPYERLGCSLCPRVLALVLPTTGISDWGAYFMLIKEILVNPAGGGVGTHITNFGITIVRKLLADLGRPKADRIGRTPHAVLFTAWMCFMPTSPD